ncbi:hypothetical protein A2V71_03035 [Candidatus Berkelbacteria bacterium RBG_13_40_8]|uniref:Uncharacterized protein n=1 Tax=Candidatus Berkelbacteria bacterium RBG_13_40_8 TaxID=1797467 RepID=A0A1F5DPG6_9BACT|nr:MAG: hypothetical protein A2V71_03035 [Candidatus Berkelbacteria bacterium RBG_13_40_8]
MKIKAKQIIIDQLKRTPIIQICCDKANISRTTYYRWRKDKKFATECDLAMQEGLALINDLAESQLINAIKSQNLTSIMYWLNHRHKSYADRLELTGNIVTQNEKLTKEQEASIKQALKLASLIGTERSQNEKKTDKK